MVVVGRWRYLTAFVPHSSKLSFSFFSDQNKKWNKKYVGLSHIIFVGLSHIFFNFSHIYPTKGCSTFLPLEHYARLGQQPGHKTKSRTYFDGTGAIFILQNNPLRFSNRRRLDRATGTFVLHQSSVTLCSSQYRTVSSIPIGSPFSMSALLSMNSVIADTGERPGGHMAFKQTTQHSSDSAISNSSSSSGSRGGGCAPPGTGGE